MTNASIIKGNMLMVFYAGKALGFSTNSTATVTTNTTTVTTKDHGDYPSTLAQSISWEITSENLYTTKEYDDLFTTMMAGDPITVRFGLKQTPADPSMNVADGNMALPYWNSQNTYYEGKVVITSLVANANNGENATFSVTLTGNGSIKKTTVNSNQTPAEPGDGQEG